MVIPLTVGICRETAPGEKRVALVPDLVGAARTLGIDVLVESGAGTSARMPDRLYREAGAGVTTREELFARCDILVGVRPPVLPAGCRFRRGQVLIALLDPLSIPFQVRRWADEGLTTIGLDLAPTALVAADPRDAAASQDRLAGCEAALLAADHFGRPLAGTPGPGSPGVARACVIGSGAAARQAAETLRRLGAQVRVVDDAAGRQVPPFLLRDVDIVVAAVPFRSGGRSPVLVTVRAMAGMRPGSVVVDTAAGPDGGNVEGARPESTSTTGLGVTVIGAGRLPARFPRAASAAYARNVTAVLERIVRDGKLQVDPADPVLAGMVVTHGGLVLHRAVWQLILDQTALAGLP
ncbi:NAD(P) transhydrogenase subunit alpha [Streptomyces sp. NBC_01207]|uniref:NAD(P) transhydrogenase subunit alpha n=1 Tax=Streptomyces sp. NBC_01207 TaxID=2903772 RepID=UPI002E15D26A|nr:NAD(P) transhydrogenase subunit alpha [Streptomyces sp. NBC_01207]